MTDAGTTVLGQGRFARFVRREDWEFVERQNLGGIVAIVALTEDGRLLLIEQYRPPVGCRVVELPAGLAGDAEDCRGEALEIAARRELLEETGYDATAMERLGAGTPSAGIVTEVVTFFRARGVRPAGPGGGHAGEEIAVHAVPLAEVDAWIASRLEAGALVDIKVWAGLHLLGKDPER